jgi:hypothetical protein
MLVHILQKKPTVNFADKDSAFTRLKSRPAAFSSFSMSAMPGISLSAYDVARHEQGGLAVVFAVTAPTVVTGDEVSVDEGR